MNSVNVSVFVDVGVAVKLTKIKFVYIREKKECLKRCEPSRCTHFFCRLLVCSDSMFLFALKIVNHMECFVVVHFCAAITIAHWCGRLQQILFI